MSNKKSGQDPEIIIMMEKLYEFEMEFTKFKTSLNKRKLKDSLK